MTKELKREKHGYKGTEQNNKKSLSNADFIRVSAIFERLSVFRTKEKFLSILILEFNQ